MKQLKNVAEVIGIQNEELCLQNIDVLSEKVELQLIKDKMQ